MKMGINFHHLWTKFDYDYLLPFFARLPLSVGRKLAYWRGLIYGRLSRDWRIFCLDDFMLEQRTRAAFSELLPLATKRNLNQAVHQRYASQSLEELEACQLARPDLRSWPVEWVGLDAVLESLKEEKGIVLVTAHYASCVLGVVLLEKLGVPIFAMTSNVTENARVHPSIQNFYRKRKQNGNRYLNGGAVLDRQGNTRRFVNGLKRGGAVVIFGELPPDPNENPLIVSFLGRKRLLTSGPQRMSSLTRSPLFSFVCERTKSGHKMIFSQPTQDPYTLIDERIQRVPTEWWAADLLPLLTPYQEAENDSILGCGFEATPNT